MALATDSAARCCHRVHGLCFGGPPVLKYPLGHVRKLWRDVLTLTFQCAGFVGITARGHHSRCEDRFRPNWTR